MSKFTLNYTGEEVNQIFNNQMHTNFNTVTEMKIYSDTYSNIKEGLLVTCTETPDIIYVYYSNNENNTTTGKFKDINANLRTSVTAGKNKIASAITAKGVSTSGNSDFDTIAANIAKISTGMKMASGNYNTASSSHYDKGTATGYLTIPINIGFTPKYVFVYCNVWDGYDSSSYSYDGGASGITSNVLSSLSYTRYGTSNSNKNSLSIQVSSMNSSSITVYYSLYAYTATRSQSASIYSWYAFG